MSNTEGLKYTPLFHSEISSSYLLKAIFHEHGIIVRAFLNKFLGLKLSDEKVHVKRENNYEGHGSIDLFMKFEHKGQETHVLVEVKVHDFKSAKKDQIETYYNAAKNAHKYADIYFIYLTQFNKNSNLEDDNITTPQTIKYFDNSKNKIDEKKLSHVSWTEFHEFLGQYLEKDILSNEEELMIRLQKEWVLAQSEKDLEEKTNIAGLRPFSDFFDGIEGEEIEKNFSYGNREYLPKRTNYVINLDHRDKSQLDEILQLIISCSNSAKVDRARIHETTSTTLKACKTFLGKLTQNADQWLLLYFYASLFNYVNTKDHVLLNGKSDFSIIVTIGNKERSLCTLRKSGIIEFGLMR